jgi:heme oxygenase (biliverdin-IX-beta and delta-forming)
MNDPNPAPSATPEPVKAEAWGESVRRLMRSSDRAALATSLGDGAPYASLVLLGLDLDATPLLLLSDLAEHSRNIARDARVSLLIDGTIGLADPLAGSRVSLLGRVEIRDDGRLLARFAAHHPSAADYASFADFRLYRMTVERAHLVAGFGRIRWVDGGEIVLAGDTSVLGTAEPSIIAHMNEDHADAVDRIAGRETGRQEAGWRMTGIDPEGADFRRAGDIARVAFALDVRDAGAARSELVRLARAGGATPAGGA